MGFFDALKKVLGADRGPAHPEVAKSWGLHATASPSPSGGDASQYDQTNWLKKLKHVLDRLPDSRPEWDDVVTEARALKLDPAWVAKSQIDEFVLLIRRTVADGVFTEAEHRKLDLARDLIGIPEAEAEAALHTVVAEAESFFGKPIVGA